MGWTHKVTWLVGGISGAIIVLLAVTMCPGVPLPNQHRIDSLTVVNSSLARDNQQLTADNVLLAEENAATRRRADSLATVARAVQAHVVRVRQTLPAASTVGDTAQLRALYATALADLDTAIAGMQAKDLVILEQKRTVAQLDSINANLRLSVQNLTTQYTNEVTIADQWETAYHKAAHPFCGTKCGVGVGVALTGLAAVLVHVVLTALGGK